MPGALVGGSHAPVQRRVRLGAACRVQRRVGSHGHHLPSAPHTRAVHPPARRPRRCLHRTPPLRLPPLSCPVQPQGSKYTPCPPRGFPVSPEASSWVDHISHQRAPYIAPFHPHERALQLLTDRPRLTQFTLQTTAVPTLLAFYPAPTALHLTGSSLHPPISRYQFRVPCPASRLPAPHHVRGSRLVRLRPPVSAARPPQSIVRRYFTVIVCNACSGGAQACTGAANVP